MKLIKHQQQPDATSCVCTCIAMLINKPASDIIAEFHDDYMEGNVSVENYLALWNISALPMLTTDWRKKDGGLYLVVAPSLNIKSLTHQLILDWRDVKAGPVVFDPNQGKTGKEYYVNKWPQDLLDGEYNLEGFSFDFEIMYNN